MSLLHTPAEAAEMVTCIPRAVWYDYGAGRGMYKNDRLQEVFDYQSEDPKTDSLFMNLPRPACENMMEFKQIIPYVALTYGRNEDLHIAVYQRGRGCGEARLHKFWSIGFGGHVNLDRTTIRKELDRELIEEVGLSVIAGKLRYRGFINLERTPVDRVHIGLGYTLELSGPMSLRRHDRPHKEEEMRLSWQPYYVVAAMVSALEPWSRLLLEDIMLEHGLQ